MENSNNQLNAVAQSWELYKSYNDRLVNEITLKGAADPLTVESINKLNNHIDTLQKKSFDITNSRPSLVAKTENYDNHEYKSAFCSYVRAGHESNLQGLELKSLSVGRDADGGYLVTPHMEGLINSFTDDNSIMRKLASVTSISSNSFEYLEEHDGVETAWVLESEVRPDTTTAKISKRSILVNEVYCQPKATQKLLDDSMIDIEGWLAEKISSAFAKAENKAFIYGDSLGKPMGILSYKDGKGGGAIEHIASGAVGDITSEGLLKLIYSLPERYASKAQFLMNRSVVHKIRSLKCPATGRYLWEPSLAQGEVSQVFGININESADMPTAAANADGVIYGDFNAGYKIIDRTGISILRDPFTEKPFVKFYATKRVGGDVVNFDALKVLKLEA